MDNDRRKLIVGSASLPLILTIRPALGQARTSLSCLDKVWQQDTPYRILYEYEDEWLRKTLDIFQLETWDEQTKKWTVLENRKFIVGTDGATYWELDRNNPNAGQALATSFRRGGGVKETRLVSRNALVYVGDDGIRGYGWEPNGGQACTRSCWTSMMPTNNA
jgi:hypothetical protein